MVSPLVSYEAMLAAAGRGWGGVGIMKTATIDDPHFLSFQTRDLEPASEILISCPAPA